MKKLGFFAMLLYALTFTACDNNEFGYKRLTVTIE